ncbi:3',5'-cyclic AMP phosphodiesterase CpdA [Nonomuraea solani]|uniref:3',5'-cyclic AMP phosphodiesterase CpdA n=1 Tax=Nonomuraea solani TaxID=1144553 RepID=A0A1H6EYB3_9ACTN|nr:metallophosphoesterase [Nonomuraea solani]SEH01956.1 3',5'-cyclic AMP phosphodiesterase CpdA [Nonomuraea solani]
MSESRLLAVSDLHVAYPENRDIVDRLKPVTPGDWLLVAGDVGERLADIAWALGLLADRFERVVWVPGNHELWSPPNETPDLRGVARYDHLVRMCRNLGVLTPEDDYPLWEGAGGPVRIVPLFLLYDYTFLPEGHPTKAAALAHAHDTGVVCTDEYMLHPDPYPTREAWCRARVELTERRLVELDDDVPLVFVNHYPLVREPTDILRYPQFAQWCGTTATRDWHRRYRTAAMIYGHLHIPRVTWYDGVRFEEVSLGYPREWKRRPGTRQLLRDVLPESGVLPGS